MSKILETIAQSVCISYLKYTSHKYVSLTNNRRVLFTRVFAQHNSQAEFTLYGQCGYAIAARGCLPPRANVCVAAPTNQISSAIRIYVRISDMGVWTDPWNPRLFPFFPFRITLLCSHIFSSNHLEVGPLKSLKGLGSAVSSPSDICGGCPGRNWNWIFSLKIWHLVASCNKFKDFFLIIKSSNFVQSFQILCWFSKHNTWIVQNIKLWLPVKQ